ncbi:S-layer homology domain-containing protein [Clostridium sp. MD294]|uniref:S-layer homology domain-containing protein n=1 Tax=Clostridium sp. MD294 TaxID=97138 RepID=UPI0002CA4E9D|nr:S-layer homology domain-containing protein [Clostridium sp. MD294]USF29389.1 hypothetical protein C820_000779 [Clostridium sp. MD294]
MKYSKILILMLLLLNHVTMAFAFSPIPSDITGHWAENTILQWQSEERIKGYEDNTFRPDNAITRAEFIHLLHSIITIKQNAIVNFSDVNTSDWFYEDISKAVSNHIISGFEDNTFRPNEMITRAQSALIISNALQLPTNTTNGTALKDDSDIPIWSKNAVYAMLNAGYISGYEDGTFRANQNMTRAEAISMLDRIDKSNTLHKNEASENDIIENSNENSIKINMLEPGNIDNNQKTLKKIVWENGDRNLYTSNEQNKNTEKTLIITKDNITEFYGKTLQYTTVKIKLEDISMELLNIKFTGNVEIISDIQTDKIPTLYLKGNTKIKHLTTSTPVIINSENNIIKTFITKAETTISGNTQITNLKCYNKTTLIDNTTITDTAQIFSNITTDSNTQINTIKMIPNTDASISANGIINKINVNGKGNISYIHLGENTNADINISDFAIVENITLYENTQCHITIKNNAELNQLLSFSHCLGSTVKNNGTVHSIIVLNPETISVENATVETAILQNITLISYPKKLQYKEGDTLSLSGISLLLEYQNNITQVVNKLEDIAFYHIQTSPTHNTILTAKHHNTPIKIYSNDLYVYTNFITIEGIEISTVDTEHFQKLIQQCKTILNDTLIKYAEEKIPVGKYYVTENDFISFKDILFLSEKLLQKENLTQQQIQNQYNILQSALHDFEEKRILSEKVITPPELSINNTLPQYGDENVIFSIENIQENTMYYYTLDGNEPTSESILYTEPVTLLPPQSTSESSITIKAIAVQYNICSAISEKTITYSAALPIEDIMLYRLKIPMIGEQTTSTVQSSNETQYIIHSFCWKNAMNTDEIVNSFEPDTIYTAEIMLKANKPYAFQNDILPKLDIIDTDIDISIDKERSNANYLCVLVTFEATPPIPTEELAEKELNYLLEQNINISVLDTDIPDFEQEIKEFCCEAILNSAQKIISKYWTLEFDVLGYFCGSSSIGITGKFTIISTIDPSIAFTSPNYVDISIPILSNTLDN